MLIFADNIVHAAAITLTLTSLPLQLPSPVPHTHAHPASPHFPPFLNPHLDHCKIIRTHPMQGPLRILVLQRDQPIKALKLVQVHCSMYKYIGSLGTHWLTPP